MANKPLHSLTFPGMPDKYVVPDITSIAPAYSASSTYVVGDLVSYDNKIWKCTTAITQAEAWTAGHWTQTNMAESAATDKTLTLPDKAADAKEVGDQIADLKEDLNYSINENISVNSKFLNALNASCQYLDFDNRKSGRKWSLQNNRPILLDDSSFEYYEPIYLRKGIYRGKYLTIGNSIIWPIGEMPVYFNAYIASTSTSVINLEFELRSNCIVYISRRSNWTESMISDSTIEQYAYGVYESNIPSVDSSLTLSGEAADANITGSKITSIREKVDNHFGDINIFEDNYINCAIDTSALKISSSPNNLSIYFPVEIADRYTVIKPFETSQFKICFTDDVPRAGTTITNYFNIASAKTIYSFESPITGYCVVWLYNIQDDEELDLDTFKSGVFAYKGEYNASLNPNSTVMKNVYDENTVRQEEYNEYYTIVKNPSGSVQYTDYPIQIKVNFPKGECLTDKCIKVLRNASEIPFQFEGVRDQNYLYNTSLTYWPDGSIKAGTLWIYDTILGNSFNEYTVRVYYCPQSTNYEKTVEVKGTTFEQQFDVLFGNNTLHFNGITSLSGKRQKGLNTDDNWREEDVYIISDQQKYYRNETLDSIEEHGNGVVFVDIIYKYHNDKFTYKRTYRVFKNQIHMQWVVRTVSVMSNVSRMVMQHCIGTNDIIEYTETPYRSIKYNYNSNTCTASIIYANGNIPRSDTYNTIPLFATTGVLGYSSSLNALRIYAGWNNTTVIDIPKDFVFTAGAIVTLNADNYEHFRHFNPLVSFATKTTIEESLNKIKGILSWHGINISKYIVEHYADTNKGMYLWADYFLYKNGSPGYKLNIVSQKFKDKITSLGVDSNSGMYNKWNDASFGMEFMGRLFPLAYCYYLEYESKNDTEETLWYKNLITASGDTVVRIFNENQDIPLQGTSSPNNNARASALHLLALAQVLNEDSDYRSTYNNLSSVIDANSALNTMLPEGNLSTTRYNHYQSFAQYEYIQANLLLPTESTVFRNYDNFIIDATEPTGQIKDQIYCPSTARRGLSSTYAYFIGSLVKTGEYQNIAFAEQLLEWLVKFDKLNGGEQFPVDNYPNLYTGTQDASVVVFEIGALCEALFL